ncbi:hypothetical protein EON65_23720 [archaeon]|nr:MAG: hypothetical protein EON65_23720 [archaeon]
MALSALWHEFLHGNYKKASAERLWQVRAGVGLLLVMVKMPMSMDYTSQQKRKMKLESAMDAPQREKLQRMVFEKNMALHKRLAEIDMNDIEQHIKREDS